MPQIDIILPPSGDFINVKNNSISNLIGDGVTSDSSAFTALINGASAGDTLFFPKGTYLISGVVGTKRVNLLGFGDATLKTTTNTFIYQPYGNDAAAYGWQISGLNFDGSSIAGTSHRGLYILENRRWAVKDCNFSKFSNGIIVWGSANPGGAAQGEVGGMIVNCRAEDCTDGIRLFRQAEYISVIGGIFNNNSNAGVLVQAGNNSIVGVKAVYNLTGVFVENDSNESKTMINGCSMNHNTTGLYITETQQGVIVTGCHLYANTKAIDMDDCIGVLLNGNQFSSGTVNINDTSVLFSDNLFDSTVGNTVTVNKTGTNSIQQHDNYEFDMTTFTI